MDIKEILKKHVPYYKPDEVNAIWLNEAIKEICDTLLIEAGNRAFELRNEATWTSEEDKEYILDIKKQIKYD